MNYLICKNNINKLLTNQILLIKTENLFGAQLNLRYVYKFT